ncbi:MAG: helix-turn-helix domain-containing protein [Clostridia bacterium]|nr:helix-turn-helix domain-containing protein [Clostridia bacterium]
MTTGEKIVKCRKEAGLTQTELAEKLGVTRQAVSRWESDFSFPETDKLLSMSKLFGCSVDWLLKYDEEERGATEVPQEEFNLFEYIKNFHYEYKSKKTVGSIPLVHINIGRGRTAKGFFAVGFKSVGIFSVGLLSLGLFSFGLLALGLLSIACCGLGFVSLGAVALGIFSAGGIAVGVISLGGVALGLFAIGGCSVGGFAFGGYAYGSYAAIGDIARGGIALGGSSASGSKFSAIVTEFEARKDEIYSQFDSLPSSLSLFINWFKSLFNGILKGSITLGNIKL